MNPAIVAFGGLTAAATAALAGSVAYGALVYSLDNSAHVFSAMQSDILAGLKMAAADVMSGEWFRPAIAGAVGLIAGAGIFVAALTGKKQSTDARFLNAIEAGSLGLTRKGGVFVGRIGGGLVKVPGSFTQRGTGKRKFLKPQILGGKKLWIDGDDVGGFVIGPPRSGKGASLIVPNCLLWPDSLVVLDMRGETYDATAGYRSTFSRVLRFSPADETGNTECYNPLDFVAVDADQRDIDINSIATALLPTPKGDSYWISDARALFAGITSWVLENPDLPDSEKNIGMVLNVIEGGDKPLREWLTEVGTKDVRAPWISSFTYTTIARFAAMADKQFDGVYGTLAASVRPFKNNRILRATSRSTFDIRAMRRENMSLYLDFRIQQIGSIGPIFNVLMVQFMDYMSRQMMKRGEKRVLVLLDEFQNLGKLENALTVATVLGGYGIPCWFFVQSLRSIDNVYTREGRQTLVNSARAQIFLGAQDPEDQRYVSQLLGERSVEMTDKSVSGGSTLFDRKTATVSVKSTMRPLMRPDELGSMSESRCIIKLRNQQPIFGVRNFYYADKELAKLAWQPITKGRFKPATAVDTAEGVRDLMSAAPVSIDRTPSAPAATPGARFRRAAVSVEVAESKVTPDDKSSVVPNFRAALARRSPVLEERAELVISRMLPIFQGDSDMHKAMDELAIDLKLALSDD